MPALLMTASLQPERREVLHELFGVNLEPQDSSGYSCIEGPSSRQQLNRYKIHFVSRPPLDQILQLINQGKKILVVANTVDRAVKMYKDLRKMGLDHKFIPFYAYHSRFKYIDRLHRQEEIVKVFKQPGPCCVVTTQICEMSFNVSADVLLSEIAPFAIIVQRLGRLNRFAENETRLGDAWFWLPDGEKPYLNSELTLCHKILEELSKENGVSQTMLSDYQRRYTSDCWERPSTQFMWSEFGSAVVGQGLRDAGSVTLDYMVRSDYERARHKGVAELFKFIVPMNKRRGETMNDLIRWRHVRIVDDELLDYSLELGGRWRDS